MDNPHSLLAMPSPLAPSHCTILAIQMQPQVQSLFYSIELECKVETDLADHSQLTGGPAKVVFRDMREAKEKDIN
jgi:hypothetical protein